jgi:dynein heavy chain
MAKPGGGRQPISPRIQSKFHILNYAVPAHAQMQHIFQTICTHKFQSFFEEIKNMAEPLAVSTITLFHQIQDNFLPIPAKSHYVFNMRDISKVFQGLYTANPTYYETKEQIIKLWAHEILRVFSDRMINFDDRNILTGYLNEQLETHFQMNYQEHCTTEGKDAVFVNFLTDDPEKRVYEEVTDFQKLRNYLMDQLEVYNSQPKLISMNLVLFKDAIHYISKINRVLELKRGHVFLVGVGGSGRHSLSRLSAFISSMTVYQLEIARGFGVRHFRDFIKDMYEFAGYRGKNKASCVFLFSDNDVVMEAFLEDVNNMLSAGVVPNLYTNDELQGIRDGAKREFKRENPNTVDTPDLV